MTLGFGCLAHMTRPVQAVGSIHISYHFGNGDKALVQMEGLPGQEATRYKLMTLDVDAF